MTMSLRKKKRKFKPHHIHLALVPRKRQVKSNPGLSQSFSKVFLSNNMPLELSKYWLCFYSKI